MVSICNCVLSIGINGTFNFLPYFAVKHTNNIYKSNGRHYDSDYNGDDDEVVMIKEKFLYSGMPRAEKVARKNSFTHCVVKQSLPSVIPYN